MIIDTTDQDEVAITVPVRLHGSVTVPVRSPVTVVPVVRPAAHVSTAVAGPSSVVTPTQPGGVEIDVAEQADSSVSIIGIPGPAGPQGPPGPAGGTYRHVQMTPDTVWTIQHNLGYYPSITTVDSSLREFYAEVNYPDVNTVVVTLSAATAGEAFLS